VSADNWAICPKCTDKRTQESRERAEAIAEAYETIPVDEWDLMREEARIEDEIRVEATFREDYEFCGADEGTLYISYSGACSKCGLSLEHKDEIKFYPEAT